MKTTVAVQIISKIMDICLELTVIQKLVMSLQYDFNLKFNKN